MRNPPPRIVPSPRYAELTLWEVFLMDNCHPRSALQKQARKRKGRAIAFFTVDAVPEAVDDETTQPH